MPKNKLIGLVKYLSATLNILLISTVSVSAQEEEQSKTDSLDEVVVSGGMREVTRMMSPIPVERYSAQFFRKNPVPNLFESLSLLNGVQPQINCNVCNTGDIHINGMEGPYTMVLIDGMPIVSSLSTVYGLMGIPSGLIKRIEVIKGPSSTLYGSEAVAGLINVITQEPGSAGKFFTDVNFTGYGELNADIAGTVRAGKWSGLLGLNAFTFQQRKDINNDNFTDIALQERISFFQKWQLQRANGLPFSIAMRLFTEDRWGGEMQWSKRWRGTDSIYGESIRTKRTELFGQYGFRVKQLPLLWEYSYNIHDQNAAYGNTFYIASQHTAFSQFRWNASLGKHHLVAGIPFRYIRYDDNTPATQHTNGNSRPDHAITTGAFVQDEWELNRAWTLLSGVRSEWNNRHGWIPSPRAALRFRPDGRQTIRLSAGNGFRVVNLFTEEHQALSGARELEILESLKPEKSWNFNLNYAGQWAMKKGFFGIDASVFYTYFTNKIIADYDTDPDKIIYANLDGSAVSKGFSLNSEMNIANKFKLMTGFSYMEVSSTETDASGKKTTQPVLFAPEWTANYAWSYIPGWAGLSFDITGKTYGPMRLPVVPNDFRRAYSPVFTMLNFQTTKKLGEKTEVYGGVKNLLNFLPENPILRPEDPFDKNVAVNNPNDYRFDPSYNYAPMQERRWFVGMRVKL